MPATERSFLELPPAQHYLDTDILINALISTQPHYGRCSSFLESLVRHGLTAVFLSSLSWLEYVHVVTRAQFRRLLSAKLQQELRINRWDEPLVRQAYLQRVLDAFDALLSQFDVVEIPLTPAIRVAALQYVAQYNVGSQDAVHLASANHARVIDLASLDVRFRRVDGLHLWNGLIYLER